MNAFEQKRTVAVVTGSRAEFGLLRPVMRAIQAHDGLRLQALVTGAHLLPPQRTADEVAAEFKIDRTIAMQSPDRVGRIADAEALSLGITGFARAFSEHPPQVVLVLGDRIEAFAAAAAAAVGGIRVAHMHGGDRAEGVADEAMRHAISKLAHIHLPATQTSAQRLIAMGEEHRRIHVVGSPAIDGLNEVPPLSDDHFNELGAPEIIIVLHPVGDDDAVEHQRAATLLALARQRGRVLALHPNHDPGRNGILRAIEESGCLHRSHLHRATFVGLLRRAKILVGNSSAGLIECAAIPIACINLGRRQAGREMPANVIDIPNWDYQTLESVLSRTLTQPIGAVGHPYGDGKAGSRTADLLASLSFEDYPLAKCNTY